MKGELCLYSKHNPKMVTSPRRVDIPQDPLERLAYLIKYWPFCPTEDVMVKWILALDGISQEAYQQENPRAKSFSTFESTMQLLKEDMCALKSNMPGGQYTYIWKKYKAFIIQLKSNHATDSDRATAVGTSPIVSDGVIPFTGKDLNDCVPLITFQLGEAFMEKEKDESNHAGEAGMSTRVKAINCLVQFTQTIREYVYGGQVKVEKKKLSFTTGKSGKRNFCHHKRICRVQKSIFVYSYLPWLS